MNSRQRAATWMVVISGIFFFLLGCRVGNKGQSQVEAISRVGSMIQAGMLATASQTQPVEEEALLAAVVCLEIHGGGISLGTVMNGRYLVTHNHFQVSPADTGTAVTPLEGSFSLYRPDGSPLIDHSPLTNLAVVAENEETLVIDFGELGGQGLFDLLGVESAVFDTGESVTPGVEVAQVTWDGEKARIDRVMVEDVRLEAGVPVLVLANPLLRGASGGGVFWNGRHVANNWSTSRIEEERSGQVLNAYSTAAINRELMLGQLVTEQPSEASAVTIEPSSPGEGRDQSDPKMISGKGM